MIAKWVNALRGRLSKTGLIVGALLFSLALTPSLVPRTDVIQGILSGCAFALGYGIGVAIDWLWHYMELKLPNRTAEKWTQYIIVGVCAVIAVFSLWKTTDWQNSVRLLMGAEPVQSGEPLIILLVAILPAVFLIFIGKVIAYLVKLASRQLAKVVPPRVAIVLGFVTVTIVVSVLVNGVLLRGMLRAADAFFINFDSLAGQFGDPPTEPTHSGSAQSLVAWDTIGHDGRIYVESGPSREDIETVTGRPAIQPLRIYAGLRSAPTLEARVALLMAEMDRVGAFDRSVLVVTMPVGTGWIDPEGVDSLEYLMGGDVATVALQYSYLTSFLSLVVEPDYGTEAAQALFKAVYARWTAMPHDTRPKLYLYGLSLGAHASQASSQLFDVLGDPYQGALWVGPPYTSPVWRWATNNRQPGSPEWLPRFSDETAIRFTNNGSGLNIADIPWGPMRTIFLQHASDPIVFFDWPLLYQKPDWLEGERGPDVSPALTWYPLVTFLQVGMDMALGLTAPPGHGHLYYGPDYLDSWVALIDPPGWDEESIAQLKSVMPSTLH